MKKVLCLCLLTLLLCSCSQRAWFDGFVFGQQYQCNKLSGQERESCLAAITTDYDRYQRERDESIRRANEAEKQ